MQIYTIGHSARSIEEFLELLKKFGIQALVDVRRFPTSNKWPQFKKEELAKALEKEGIKYFWLAELGGFRRGGYSNYISTKEFKLGLKKLIEIAEKFKTAIMCAEALYFKCHRRFIASELTKEGIAVRHILSPDRLILHRF